MLTSSQIEWLVLAGSLVLMVVLWGFVRRMPRAADLQIRTGVRHGLAVGAVIIGSLGVLGAASQTGRTFVNTTLDFGGALLLGLVVGAILAIVYVWLGLLLMPVGILLGAGRRWVSVGTWLAVVPAAFVIGVSIALLAFSQAHPPK